MGQGLIYRLGLPNELTAETKLYSAVALNIFFVPFQLANERVP